MCASFLFSRALRKQALRRGLSQPAALGLDCAQPADGQPSGSQGGEAGTVNSVLHSAPDARDRRAQCPNLEQTHRLGGRCRARPSPRRPHIARQRWRLPNGAGAAAEQTQRPAERGGEGGGGGWGDLLRERGGLGPAPPAPRPPGHSEALTDLDGRLAAQQQLQALGVVRQAAVVQGCAAFRRLLVQVPAGEDGEEAGAESRPRQVTETRAGERPAAGQSPAPLPGWGRDSLGSGPGDQRRRQRRPERARPLCHPPSHPCPHR